MVLFLVEVRFRSQFWSRKSSWLLELFWSVVFFFWPIGRQELLECVAVSSDGSFLHFIFFVFFMHLGETSAIPPPPSFQLFLQHPGWQRGGGLTSQASHRSHSWSEIIISATALSGLLETKPVLTPPPPPNEPAQQSLLSDLYLSESGGRKAALSAHSSAFVGPSIVWSEPCASSGMPRIRKYWDLFFLVSRDDKQVEICLTAGRKHGFFIRGDAFHFPY